MGANYRSTHHIKLTWPTDERYFTSPDDFVPERWTTKPEMVKNESVFAPFSVGKSQSSL